MPASFPALVMIVALALYIFTGIRVGRLRGLIGPPDGGRSVFSAARLMPNNIRSGQQRTAGIGATSPPAHLSVEDCDLRRHGPQWSINHSERI
jgi:hypothetical protein